MRSTLFFFLLSAAATLAAPAADHALEKRKLKDRSGKTTMQFDCSDTTIPDFGGAEGTGEGGEGIFSTDMFLTAADGKKIYPSSCKKKDGYCGTCEIKGGGLSSTISVTGCSDPAGGSCSMEFSYKGYDYNSQKKQPKCGHEGGGLKAFSSDQKAICYFNV